MNISDTQHRPKRLLSSGFTLAVTIGGIIGLGILRTPGEVAAVVPDPLMFVSLWVFGGLFILLSTVTAAELVGMTPRSGGIYVLMRRAYGPFPGFVIGWVDWLSFVGDIALKAVVVTEFTALLIPAVAHWRTPLAIMVSSVFAALQLRSITLGAKIQQIAAAVMALIVVGFTLALVFAETAASSIATSVPQGAGGLGAWSLVVASIIYTYDGWIYASYFSGEIKGGSGAVARASIKGVIIVILLYVFLAAALAWKVPLTSLAGNELALAGALEMVVSVDINQDALDSLAQEHPIQTRVEDLSTTEGVMRAVTDADIVIGSVPYSIGYVMLEGVIRAGKNIVDISYFLEDPFGLDDLAKEKGVTVVVDCGVAPGMANIILGDFTRKMKVTRYECYVGGIPKARNAPFEYKSPFPVLEVLEEYAGSCRRIEDGKVVVEPMLSETATIEFEEVGPLACLNSDGLRTLIRTMDIPDMLEKTLRYPGHIDAMRIFRDAGFLNLDPIQVEGTSVRPIDVTASLISPLWKYGPGEADLTVMRLVISGEEEGEPVTYTCDLYDEYDPATGALSMARTTGYTCTAVARLVLDGGYSQKGISPPEFVGRASGCWGPVEKYLEDRGVRCILQPSSVSITK